MNFTEKTIPHIYRNKYLRETGSFRSGGASTVIVNNNGSGNSTTVITGEYLPATRNEDGTYTVDASAVKFEGHVIASGEVIAHKDGTATSGDGSYVTVIDSLTSDSTTDALSAAQGKVLKGMIDDMSIGDNYYTKDEINDKLGSVQVDLSGYYTKTEVDDKISSIEGTGGNVDLSDYYKKSEVYNINETYSKEEIDEKIDSIVIGDDGEISLQNYYTKSETYNKSEVDAKLDEIVVGDGEINLQNYYTKSEVDEKIENIDVGENVDLSNYYNKTEVDDLISNVEVDLSNYYTKTEVDDKIIAKVTDISFYEDPNTWCSLLSITNTSLPGTIDFTLDITATYTVLFPVGDGYFDRVVHSIPYCSTHKFTAMYDPTSDNKLEIIYHEYSGEDVLYDFSISVPSNSVSLIFKIKDLIPDVTVPEGGWKNVILKGSIASHISKNILSNTVIGLTYFMFFPPELEEKVIPITVVSKYYTREETYSKKEIKDLLIDYTNPIVDNVFTVPEDESKWFKLFEYNSGGSCIVEVKSSNGSTRLIQTVYNSSSGGMSVSAITPDVNATVTHVAYGRYSSDITNKEIENKNGTFFVRLYSGKYTINVYNKTGNITWIGETIDDINKYSILTVNIAETNNMYAEYVFGSGICSRGGVGGKYIITSVNEAEGVLGGYLIYRNEKDDYGYTRSVQYNLVEDSLTSSNSFQALSAKQGKLLNERIDQIIVGGDVSLDNYYTKTETDDQFYSKTRVDSKFDTVYNTLNEDYYNKSQVNNAIANIDFPETDLSNYYNKTEVDTKFDNIDFPETVLSNYYNKTEVDTFVYDLESKIESSGSGSGSDFVSTTFTATSYTWYRLFRFDVNSTGSNRYGHTRLIVSYLGNGGGTYVFDITTGASGVVHITQVSGNGSILSSIGYVSTAGSNRGYVYICPSISGEFEIKATKHDITFYTTPSTVSSSVVTNQFDVSSGVLWTNGDIIARGDYSTVKGNYFIAETKYRVKEGSSYVDLIDNSLTSTSTAQALSAKQGSELKALIDALTARVAELEAKLAEQ